MLTDERLQEIKKLNEERAPGDWFWWGYIDSKEIELHFRDPKWGLSEVMRSQRYGMQGAQPAFYDPQVGVILPASGMRVINEARKNTSSPDWNDLDNPNARFIAKAPQAVTDLLDEVRRLRAELAELKAREVVGA